MSVKNDKFESFFTTKYENIINKTKVEWFIFPEKNFGCGLPKIGKQKEKPSEWVIMIYKTEKVYCLAPFPPS